MNKRIKLILIDERGYKCERCKKERWQRHPIPLQVHHIDGNHNNDSFDNLKLLCPNCHALTKNYSVKKKGDTSEFEIYTAIKNTSSLHEAIISLGLSPSGYTYSRFKKVYNKSNNGTLDLHGCYDCSSLIPIRKKYCEKCIRQRRLDSYSRCYAKKKFDEVQHFEDK